MLKRYPSDRDLRSALVQDYIEAGRIPQAQSVLNAAIMRNPQDQEALLQMSDLYVMAGRYSEAERALRQVVHDRPDSAAAHFTLARVFRSRNELTEGQELNEPVRLDPNLLSARLELAQFLMLHKDAEASLDLLNQTPAAQKDNLDLTIQRNAALFALGRKADLRASLDATMCAGFRQPALFRNRASFGCYRVSLPASAYPVSPAPTGVSGSGFEQVSVLWEAPFPQNGESAWRLFPDRELRSTSLPAHSTAESGKFINPSPLKRRSSRLLTLGACPTSPSSGSVRIRGVPVT